MLEFLFLMINTCHIPMSVTEFITQKQPIKTFFYLSNIAWESIAIMNVNGDCQSCSGLINSTDGV